MKVPTIELDAEHELRIRRNEPDGAILELWYIQYRNKNKGECTKQIGDLFTFYDPEYTAEGTVPHWRAQLYFLKDYAVSKELGQLIGKVLLERTTCREPMIFTAYPYLGYEWQLGENNLSFAIDFGEPYVPD